MNIDGVISTLAGPGEFLTHINKGIDYGTKTSVAECFREASVIFDSSMQGYPLIMNYPRYQDAVYCIFGKASMDEQDAQTLALATTFKLGTSKLEDSEKNVTQQFYYDNVFWLLWRIIKDENFQRKNEKSVESPEKPKGKIWKKKDWETDFHCYEEKYVQYDSLDNPLQGDILHKKSKVRATVQGGQTTVAGQNPATIPNTKTEAEEYFDEATQNQQNAGGEKILAPANGTGNANSTGDGEPPDMSEKIKKAIVIFDNRLLLEKNSSGFNFIINFKDKSYLLGRVNNDKEVYLFNELDNGVMYLFNELDNGELKQETRIVNPLCLNDLTDLSKILDYENEHSTEKEKWIWKKTAGETKFRCFEKK